LSRRPTLSKPATVQLNINSFVKGSVNRTSATTSLKALIHFLSNPSCAILRARHDVATSNLVNHAKICDGSSTREQDQGTVAAFAYGSSYSAELLRVNLALWCATSYRPFLIVEDTYFQKTISLFNNQAKIPSDSTISRDVKDFYKIGKENLKAFIAVSSLLRI
jgi:hypothetical protein